MSRYEDQVRLLLRVLPLVQYETPGDEPFFALKGGTALNCFLWDLPRLSVDIDLTFCPLLERDESIQAMVSSLERLSTLVPKSIPGASSRLGPKQDTPKLFVRLDNAEIKIEPNTTARGHVFPTEIRSLQPNVVERFEMDVQARCLSVPDLFGGKLCAALDRQHPRDLFDAERILRTEGFSDSVRTAFLVYLLGHNRPISELLDPNFQPLDDVFEKEFAGMAYGEASVHTLEETRRELVTTIQSGLTDRDKRFLVSFKAGDPDWSLLDVPRARNLPAIQWKMQNIEVLKQTPKKHAAALKKLEFVLDSMYPNQGETRIGFEL